MARCGSCEHKKKVRSTTFYYCELYDTILPTNPAMQCDECIRNRYEQEDNSTSNSKKKDFIQLK